MWDLLGSERKVPDKQITLGYLHFGDADSYAMGLDLVILKLY